VGYCQHCNEKGVQRRKRMLKSASELRKSEVLAAEDTTNFWMPSDAQLVYHPGGAVNDELPGYAKGYLATCGMLQYPTAKAGVTSGLSVEVTRDAVFSESNQRLYWPFYYGNPGIPSGYWARFVKNPNTTNTGVKWLKIDVDKPHAQKKLVHGVGSLDPSSE